MIKDTKPNFFDKLYMRLTKEPVWAGTYNRTDWVWASCIPPSPVYHAVCETHGYFKGIPKPKVIDGVTVYGIYCKCGFFHALKWRGRQHLTHE